MDEAKVVFRDVVEVCLLLLVGNFDGIIHKYISYNKNDGYLSLKFPLTSFLVLYDLPCISCNVHLNFKPDKQIISASPMN